MSSLQNVLSKRSVPLAPHGKDNKIQIHEKQRKVEPHKGNSYHTQIFRRGRWYSFQPDVFRGGSTSPSEEVRSLKETWEREEVRLLEEGNSLVERITEQLRRLPRKISSQQYGSSRESETSRQKFQLQSRNEQKTQLNLFNLEASQITSVPNGRSKRQNGAELSSSELTIIWIFVGLCCCIGCLTRCYASLKREEATQSEDNLRNLNQQIEEIEYARKDLERDASHTRRVLELISKINELEEQAGLREQTENIQQNSTEQTN